MGISILLSLVPRRRNPIILFAAVPVGVAKGLCGFVPFVMFALVPVLFAVPCRSLTYNRTQPHQRILLYDENVAAAAGGGEMFSSEGFSSEQKQDKALGLFFIFVSLICWGTWPSLFGLCTVFTGMSSKQRSTMSTSMSSSDLGSENDDNYQTDNEDEDDDDVDTEAPAQQNQPLIIKKKKKKKVSSMDSDDDEGSIFSSIMQTSSRIVEVVAIHTTLVKQRLGQGRHPCHVYLDYAISYVIVGSFALPLLSSLWHSLRSVFTGEAPLTTTKGTAEDYLKYASKHMMIAATSSSNFSFWLAFMAILGGSLLALGNLTTQWAITAFNAPLTTVLALQASTCVIVGTSWNYNLQPELTPRPGLLKLGVCMFLVAIVFSVYAQNGYQEEQHLEQESMMSMYDSDGNKGDDDDDDDITVLTTDVVGGDQDLSNKGTTTTNSNNSHRPIPRTMSNASSLGGSIAGMSLPPYHPSQPKQNRFDDDDADGYKNNNKNCEAADEGGDKGIDNDDGGGGGGIGVPIQICQLRHSLSTNSVLSYGSFNNNNTTTSYNISSSPPTRISDHKRYNSNNTTSLSPPYYSNEVPSTSSSPPGFVVGSNIHPRDGSTQLNATYQPFHQNGTRTTLPLSSLNSADAAAMVTGSASKSVHDGSGSGNKGILKQHSPNNPIPSSTNVSSSQEEEKKEQHVNNSNNCHSFQQQQNEGGFSTRCNTVIPKSELRRPTTNNNGGRDEERQRRPTPVPSSEQHIAAAPDGRADAEVSYPICEDIVSSNHIKTILFGSDERRSSSPLFGPLKHCESSHSIKSYGSIKINGPTTERRPDHYYQQHHRPYREGVVAAATTTTRQSLSSSWSNNHYNNSAAAPVSCLSGSPPSRYQSTQSKKDHGRRRSLSYHAKIPTHAMAPDGTIVTLAPVPKPSTVALMRPSKKHKNTQQQQHLYHDTSKNGKDRYLPQNKNASSNDNKRSSFPRIPSSVHLPIHSEHDEEEQCPPTPTAPQVSELSKLLDAQGGSSQAPRLSRPNERFSIERDDDQAQESFSKDGENDEEEHTFTFLTKKVSMLRDTEDDPCDIISPVVPAPAARKEFVVKTKKDEEDTALMMSYTTMMTSTANGDGCAYCLDRALERARNSAVGIAVAFVGGLCFGFFSPLFNISINDPFRWNELDGTMISNDDRNRGLAAEEDGTSIEDIIPITPTKGLSVCLANTLFASAFTLTSVIWNIYLMEYPPRVDVIMIERSTIRQYLCKDSISERVLAWTAGALCALGNALQFQGGALAGFAAADIVQAFPLVATLWDVIIFGEFRSASQRIIRLLAAMYVAYIIGIICLACSIISP